jgi:hypothetical protein
MIYTNNKGPKEWAINIKNYFHKKINYELFVKIIGAFKIKGKHLEFNRTTNKKTINDFIKCTKLSIDTEICFIDDNYHHKMVDDNVFYIKLDQYKYSLSFKELIQRLVKSNILKKYINDETFFNNILNVYLNNSNYKPNYKTSYELENYKMTSKKTMLYLQTFFDSNWREIDVNDEYKSESESDNNVDFDIESISDNISNDMSNDNTDNETITDIDVNIINNENKSYDIKYKKENYNKSSKKKRYTFIKNKTLKRI